MIYLLKSNDKLKIGYTKDFESRIKQYKLHNPDIEVIDCKDGLMKDEQILHSICSKYKVSNEWYKHCDEVITEFVNYIPLEANPEIQKLNYKIKQQNDDIISLKTEINIHKRENYELKEEIRILEKTINEYKRITKELIDLLKSHISPKEESKE